MIGLPKSTEFNKRIPKQKFYEKIDVSPALKKVFVEQVRTIYWRNKIAVTTINLEKGKEVTELEVFEVKLSKPLTDDALMRQIDREIPYHILFLLEFEGKYQAWLGYKEAAASGTKAFKVNGYYHTDWLEEKDLPLKLEGLSLDAVYENYLKQIAGDTLSFADAGESIKDAITRDDKKKELQKKIDALRSKLRREQQFNKQVEINGEIKRLVKELEVL